MNPMDEAWSMLKAVAGQPLFPIKRHEKLPNLEGFQMGRRGLSSAALPSSLSYYGQKGWLVPQLREDFEPYREHGSFHDVLGGSGAALYGVNPKRGSWHDTSEPLVNFKQHLKRGLTIPHGGPNTKEVFNELRDTYNAVRRAAPHSKEAAQLYFILNRRGWRGMMEENKQGNLNTSWGGPNPSLEREFDLTPYQRPLHRWKMGQQDFRTTMQQLRGDPDAYAFLDGPYPTRQGKYGQDDFPDELWEQIRDLALEHKGPSMTTTYATPEMLDLFDTGDFDVELQRPPHVQRTAAQTPELIARRGPA